MSSPTLGGVPPADVSNYVDLRIYDRSDADIFATMRAATQYYLPGWQPYEGNPEMVLGEAFALAQAELIMAINRVPGAVTQTILQLADLYRDDGAAPVAEVAITFSDDLGHTVPAGTRLYLQTDTGEVVTFLVESPGAEALRGANTATASVISDTFTAAANGVEATTALFTADPLPFVDRVVLSVGVTDGRDPETDDDYLDRGAARLQRLSDALVVPHQFAAAAEEHAEVERAVAIDLFDPGAGPRVLRTNLAVDPSFESGATQLTQTSIRSGVTATAPAVSTSGSPADGAQFAFTNVTGAAGGSTGTADVVFGVTAVAVTAGKDYRFQYDALITGGAFYARVGVEWYDASGTRLVDEPAVNGLYLPLTINGWRTLGITTRAPTGARTARMGLHIANGTSGSSLPVRFDRMLIEDAATYNGTWFAGNAYALGPNTQDDPGHITVAVLGDGPALLSASAKQAIQDDLMARSVAELTVHVVDVDMRPVPVRTRIHTLPGNDFSDVAAAVATAIRAYLNPLTWAYGAVVRHNEMVSLIDQVDGVDYVDEVYLQDGENTVSTSYTTGNLPLVGLTALPVWSQNLTSPAAPGRGIIVEAV